MTAVIVSLIAVGLAIAAGDWLGRAIEEWKNRK